MIDFEKIGKRILEERKYLRRISQEKMAEDLGMYQADISNLEKAKSGSGITDLAKLDMIADYFEMPLEILLFGRRQDQMEKYFGSKMQLKSSTKKRSVKHTTLLKKLMGLTADDENAKGALDSVTGWECGPYMIYLAFEHQFVMTSDSSMDNPSNHLLKEHLYVLYQDEVIASLTAAISTVMQHIYKPSFDNLKEFIMPDIFDLNETLQILNPYWLLYQFPISKEETSDLMQKMYQRMDDLRKAGEDRIIYYVESAYVREDCRRNGILRLMIDVLKKQNKDAMIWLSLEPTSGAELDTEYNYHALYEASELGQLNLNASIAERLGFTIDSKTEDRQTERVEEDGSVVIETIPVRRTAYYLPKKIRDIMNGDGDLLAYARARKKMLVGDIEKPSFIDVFQGTWKKHGFIISIKLVYKNETVYAFARGMSWDSRWLGVSKENPAPTGEFVETIEKYQSLNEAEQSKYYLGLKVAEQLLGAVLFGTVRPEDVTLDDLR